MDGPLAPTASDTETTGIRVPPPLFYVAGFLLGVGLELAFPIDRAPTPVTVAGAAIGVVGGLVLDGSAMRFFRRAGTSMIPFKPSTALVTTGPYRFTRNPAYLGMALIYVGIALLADAPWALVPMPLVLILIDRGVIVREERYLEREFGEEYVGYKRGVRRWV
jgi:protein-S-isoprenylcysteine O-methyltransferase Ste14